MKKLIFSFIVVLSLFVGVSSVNAKVPGIDAPIVPCTGIDDCNFGSLVTLAQNIITFLLYASSAIAAACFFFAGYLYLTANGNSGQITRAHNIFKNVVIGLIIALSAWLIVSTILKALVPADVANYSLLEVVK